ncbi:MAG: type III pantothenate kinase [Balneolaceae bacterium]
MQFIYLDIGNSNIKAAIKNDLNWERIFECRSNEYRQLENWLASLGNESRLIMTSVLPGMTNQVFSSFNRENVILITNNHIPSYLLDYATPKTLGIDRFLACYGAVSSTGSPVVVIDAGTACTVDYMSADYIYRGGVIMPGLSSIALSVQQFLPILPVVDEWIPKEWPGNSTETCLQWGIIGFFIEGIQGFLNKYREKFGDYQLFLTGGDGYFLYKYLDQSYNSKFRYDLVFEGLDKFHENHF